MFLKKRQKLIAALLGVLLVGTVFSVTMFSILAGTGDTFAFADGELKDSYLVGQTVTIPNGYFTENGAQIAAKAVVILPDGSGIAKSGVTLDVPGAYEVRYQALSGNKVLEKVYSFTAKEALYSVSSPNSSVYLGKASDVTKYNADGKSGAVVSLSSADTFSYSKTIDMSGKTMGDELVSISVLPVIPGVADATHIVVRLTDTVDPENYVEVVAKKAGTGADWLETWTYATAAANGQSQSGLENQSWGKYYFEGKYYIVHTNDKYGAGARFSMSGWPNYTAGAIDDNVGTENLVVSCDYAARRFYINGSLIMDLDAQEFQTTLWDGFTFDQCKLSVYGESYNAASLNLLINSVDGEMVLGDNVFTDSEKPTISVDDSELLLLPNLVVGKKVVLPSATAYDSTDGMVDTDVDVYVGYRTDLQNNVQIADGGFIPTRSTEYTIVYSATDRSGNTVEKLYRFNAIKSAASPELTFDSGVVSCNVGEEISIAYPSVTGNYGNFTITVAAQLGDEIAEIATVKSGDAPTELYWRPMQAGDYSICYKYADSFYTFEEDYKVSVSSNGKTVIVDRPALPAYIVMNATNQTPKLNGYRFVDGKAVETPAALYITSAPNYEGSAPYNADSFKVTDGEFCYLTYVLDDAKVQYKIPVVNVGLGGSVELAKYFVGYESFTSDSALTQYLVKNNDGVYELSFVNTVQVFDFRFIFSAVEDTASYSAVEIVLTDSKNASNQIVVRYEIGDGKFDFSLNGGKAYAIQRSFFGESILFTLSTTDGLASPCANYSFNVSDISGSAIEGFDIPEAYLSIRLIGVEDESKANIGIEKINNQTINDVNGDRAKPETMLNVVKGEFSIGTAVTIPGFYYADVLSAYCNATLKVTAPDGSIVTSLDGVKLEGSIDLLREYDIELSQNGAYEVYYYIVDDSGNKTTYIYMINVRNSTPPQITIGDYEKTVSLGSTVQVADIDISGNSLKENCNIKITIIKPSTFMEFVAENTFVASESGIYTVIYEVYDELGNVNFAQYTIKVQ